MFAGTGAGGVADVERSIVKEIASSPSSRKPVMMRSSRVGNGHVFPRKEYDDMDMVGADPTQPGRRLVICFPYDIPIARTSPRIREANKDPPPVAVPQLPLKETFKNSDLTLHSYEFKAMTHTFALIQKVVQPLAKAISIKIRDEQKKQEEELRKKRQGSKDAREDTSNGGADEAGIIREGVIIDKKI